MFNTTRAYWRKLDNAAKIFPATSDKNDPRVFRFYCELKEMVEKEVLQQALDLTLEKYPLFLSVMRKGLFWFYLEESEKKPIVKEEHRLPCSTLFIQDRKSLLFEVTYYKERINFEVFHALTDGTGATQFLRELVKNYLYLLHQKDGLEEIVLVDETLTVQDQEDDSFFKYYSKEDAKKGKEKKKKVKSYQIKGTKMEYGTMQLAEGILSVKEVLAKAREYNVSITVFLTTVFLFAIYEEMSKRQEKKPVILMIPINLRNFFPSESMLNFFGWMNVGYQFEHGVTTFEDVLQSVKKSFEEELTKERVGKRMNDLIDLEQNPILRVVPLELKNLALQAGAKLTTNNITAIFSNMSVIKMPKQYEDYIQHFGVFTSTPKTELCMCSFRDELVLNFTSRYVSVNIQRNFFRILKGLGIQVRLPEKKLPEHTKTAYIGMKLFQWFSFLCIAASVIAGMINYVYTPQLRWGYWVIGGALSMWMALAIGFVKRRNLIKNAMWQLVIVSVGSILWDLFTGWHKWSLDYVLPCVCIIIMLSMMIITKAQRLLPQDYMIYYVMASICGLIPFLLVVVGAVKIAYPSVICTAFSFLFLVSLFIFRKNDLLQELHKKLHI